MRTTGKATSYQACFIKPKFLDSLAPPPGISG
jgi:hypothetical protein